MNKFMRYCLAIVLLFTVANAATAQVRKLPAAVTEAFRVKYPMALNVEWRDRLSGFTAGFDLDNVHYDAKFNNKGIWQSTENKLDEKDLPTEIKDGFQKSKYSAEWTIDESYKIQIPGEKIQYRVQIEKNDIQKKNLLFSSEGRLISDKITL